MRTTILLLGVLALSGCAAMSPEECEFADWDSLGELDARSGRGYDYLAQRGKACNKAGIAVDTGAYRRGWERGIVHFCQPDRGFEFGISGKQYGSICPVELEADFMAGYAIGAGIHQARVARDAEASAVEVIEARLANPTGLEHREVRDLEQDLARRRVELRRLERELGRLEGQAITLGYRP